MRLTAVTIATNEETHIALALRSVQGLADDIIVVDGGSTDRTVEIARTFTDKVFVNPWPGYGKQKNFALERATGGWVLFLDADEEVPKDLATEIRAFIDTAPPDVRVAFLRIITFFLGWPLRHLWGTNPRLLRRMAARWDHRTVHERVTRGNGSTVSLNDPDTALLSAPLLHPSHYGTLTAYLERRERYTTRDAEEMAKSGTDRLGKPVTVDPRSPLSVGRFLTERAAKQFIRLAVRKRGVLDGWRGWLWCLLSAQYEYLTCRKYLARLRAKRQYASVSMDRHAQP